MVKSQNSNVTFRLHLIVFMWGFTGIMGKLISITALPLVFWRMLIASIAIFIILKIKNISIKITRQQLFQYLGIGTIVGLHWWCFFLAIKVSNVSVALSTLSTGSLFMAFLEPIFYKRKVSYYEIILSIIVIICLTLIFRASPEYILGITLGILCSFLSALFSVLNGVLQKDVSNNPRKMIFYEMIGGFLLITAILLFSNQIHLVQEVKQLDFLWLIILGAGLTAYPMVESVKLMEYLSPYTLVLTINLEPIYGIIFAYLIFGESEHMSTTFYLATFVMIAVIVINGLLKNRNKQSLILID